MAAAETIAGGEKTKGQYQPPFCFCFKFPTSPSFNTPYCSSVDFFEVVVAVEATTGGSRSTRPRTGGRVCGGGGLSYFDGTFPFWSSRSTPSLFFLPVGVMDAGEVRRGGFGSDQAGG